MKELFEKQDKEFEEKWQKKYCSKNAKRFIKAICPHCAEEHTWSTMYGCCPKDLQERLIKNGYKIIKTYGFNE